MKIRIVLISAIALVALLLNGCGGGGSSLERSKGSLSVTIDWPDPSRLIPVNAKSIRLELSDGVDTATPLDLTPTTPSGTIGPILAKETAYTATATAYDKVNPDDPGAKKLAKGTAQVIITPGPSGTPFTVVMASRATHMRFTVTPAGGSAATLDVAANASGSPQNVKESSYLTVVATPATIDGGVTLLPLDNNLGTPEFSLTASGNVSAASPAIANGNETTITARVAATGTGSGTVIVTYRETGDVFTLPITIADETLVANTGVGNVRNFADGLVLNDIAHAETDLSDGQFILRDTQQKTKFQLDLGGADGGSFQLRHGGVATGAIPVVANDIQVRDSIKTALEGIASVGFGKANVTVNSPDLWDIEFDSSVDAFKDNGDLTDDSGEFAFESTALLTGGTPSNEAITFVSPLVYDAQGKTIVGDPNATPDRLPSNLGFSFDYSYGGSGDTRPGRIAYDGLSSYSFALGGNTLRKGGSTFPFGGIRDLAFVGSTGYALLASEVKSFATSNPGALAPVTGPGFSFSSASSIAGVVDAVDPANPTYLWVLESSLLKVFRMSGATATAVATLSGPGVIDIAASGNLLYTLTSSGVVTAWRPNGSSSIASVTLSGISGMTNRRVCGASFGVIVGFSNASYGQVAKGGIRKVVLQ